MVEKSVCDSFAEYQTFLETEAEIRESIRETTKGIEKHLKVITGLLQGIHQDVSTTHSKEVAKKCFPVLEELKPVFQELSKKVPAGEYFRFHDNWKYVTTKLAFTCSLIHYLQTDSIAGRIKIAGMLGLGVDPKESSIFLDIEDYVQGLLMMTSELSRYAINCVANGELGQPRKVFKVMSDLQQGFSELNLKNDHIRRLFDGLKYDVKKVEQVMYDIAVRGLNEDSSAAMDSNTTPPEKGPGEGEGQESTNDSDMTAT